MTTTSINKALVYNRTSNLDANTAALPTDITPSLKCSVLRVWVDAGVTSVFNVTWTDGTTKTTHGLNRSVAITAGDLEAFDVPAMPGYSYNFEFESAQTSGFPTLFVQEVAQ